MAWLRKISLNIYVSGKLYKTYTADGTRKTLAISFNVSKNSVGEPNESTVVLTNVSPDTRATLLACTNKDRATVELFAGYEDDGLTLLASGDLIKMWPEKQDTENTFTLTFLDGFQAVQNSHLEQQFNPGTPIKDIVLSLAGSFANNGVAVDSTKVHIVGAIGSRGYTVSGRTATTLDLLAASYGFTWSIQDGVFQAYMDENKSKKASQKVYSVSYRKQNLLKATPELGEKYMQQIGMKIEAILNPKCKCMDLIDLESLVYPQYDGKYEIHNVQFTGDTNGTDWKMEIDSKTIVSKEE